MCGRKSDRFCPVSGTGSRRLATFVLCLLLLASPSWAAAQWFFLDGTGSAVQEQAASLPEQPTQEVAVEPSQVLPSDLQRSPAPSTSSSGATTQELTTLFQEFGQELEDSRLVSRSLKESFALLEQGLEKARTLEAAEDKVQEEAIRQLLVYETQNTSQADEISTLSAQLKKETGTKAYARVGGVLGFDDMMPTYGVTGAIGLRWGGSFLTEVGASYIVGSIVDPLRSFSLDNLQISASIGWEW